MTGFSASACPRSPGKGLHSSYAARLRTPQTSRSHSFEDRRSSNIFSTLPEEKEPGNMLNTQIPRNSHHLQSFSPDQGTYEDRLLPSRDSEDLQTSFDLLSEEHLKTPIKQLQSRRKPKINVTGIKFSAEPGLGSPENSQDIDSNTDSPNNERNAHLYNQILRTELLGPSFQSDRTPCSPSSLKTPESKVSAKNALRRKRMIKKRFDPRQCKGIKRNLFQFKGSSEKPKIRTDFLRASTEYALSPLSSLSNTPVISESYLNQQFNSKPRRKIPKMPFKILDAPSLKDDFYLNLMDWSSQNVLGVGLHQSVYLWNGTTSKVSKLLDLSVLNPTEKSNEVTSVCWNPGGTELAVGTRKGKIQLWDVEKQQLIRIMEGHGSRVGALAWAPVTNESSVGSLVSGSRDKTIGKRDVRSKNDLVTRLLGHQQEVCGLRWSFDGEQLASGGNDNMLMVWDKKSTQYGAVCRFSEHKAAVKAIAWSPHQKGLLCSGGGTADRCIRFWNTLESPGRCLSCYDTGSQVCNLVWAKNVNEVVSTHGFSLNQVIVWSYPKMRKVATLTGHSMRVLFLANSPDGETIVTGAGDETLRFWSVFPGTKRERLSNSALFPQPGELR
eukprot:snap_masked-scaffold_72-processed-gene-0.14-mRNA-1 protein AED:0.21 eAED:0.21 QI:64/1/1/1/1/1/2/97/609